MTRKYKSEVNIEWCPPPRICITDPKKSGDRSPIPNVDLNRPQYRLQNVNDIQEISPLVRKLASLEFAQRKKHVQVMKIDALKEVQRHDLDHASMESTIACLTIRIRNLQKHFSVYKYDKVAKVGLKEKIEQRNCMLRQLRRMDYKRYEWLMEKLDLVFYAKPNPIGQVTRKGSMLKLTKIYCDNIREDRLETYKKELAEQKLKFIEEKKEKLAWIEKEERELSELIAKK
uniref:Small ribosomal subunit protein uS15m n=1 Tax=Evadne anonyx TaxID=141404 RepID=A0A9N6ZGM0_9CRUS|nr:EOG090X09BQ [Evadne anonyx]